MIKAVFEFEDKSISVHSENTKLVSTEFPFGLFKTRPGEHGVLRILRTSFKELHDPFPNQKSEQIFDAVNKFMDSEYKEQCKEMGFVYKMNFLLHGRQGVGKTAIINYIANKLIENHNAIVFRIDGSSMIEGTWALAEQIREIQGNLIVFIMDEFDRYTAKDGEGFIKNLLDGNRSIDNSMVFAATNYLDRIPSTIRNRPSRFRVVSKIEPINDKDVIKNLITDIHAKSSKPFLTDSQIEELSGSVSNTTIDQIKTAMIDMLMNVSLDDPIDRGVGFTVTGEDSKNNKESKFSELKMLLGVNGDGSSIEKIKKEVHD